MSDTRETDDSTDKPQGRLRWRRNPLPGFCPPDRFVLTNGKTDFMTVQGKKGTDLFFWYGLDVNTTGVYVDLATAKAQALAHYKEVTREQPAAAPRRRPR